MGGMGARSRTPSSHPRIGCGSPLRVGSRRLLVELGPMRAVSENVSETVIEQGTESPIETRAYQAAVSMRAPLRRSHSDPANTNPVRAVCTPSQPTI